MAAQAFFYNAIFFTYALVLTKFYGVASGDVGWYILPFAAGNFLGPVLLGRLFDTLGRRVDDRRDLCAFRPAAASICGALFLAGALTATTQTLAGWWCSSSPRPPPAPPISPSAKPFRWRSARWPSRCSTPSARALGGVAAPLVFGWLIDSGSRINVFEGYAFAAALMVRRRLRRRALAVRAERKSLEDVAKPLSAV